MNGHGSLFKTEMATEVYLKQKLSEIKHDCIATLCLQRIIHKLKMIALQRHTLKERMPHSACRELFRNNILHHELSVNLIFMVNFCLISGIRNATLSKREFLLKGKIGL